MRLRFGVPEDRASDKPASPDTFSFFSLEGDRFDAEGMPAEAGKEVAAYREALVEIAVDLWKKANPDRRRAPAGFGAAFDLRLTGVDGGSARPQLKLNRPTRGVSDQEWAEWTPFFEQARDLATNRVHDVETSDAVPGDLDPTVRRALGRVGSTPESNERLVLGSPTDDARRAAMTRRVRQVLRQIDEVLPEEPRPAAAVGVISEYDGEKLSFVLRTEEGPRVLCLLEHFNESLSERVREHLALDGVTAPDVRVEGQTLDDEMKVRRIFNVHLVEVVWTMAEKVIVHRLRSLTRLKPGWVGPGTDAPSPELAELLEAVVTDIATLGHSVGVTANADGALVLEWRVSNVEYTVELDADRRLFLCADNVETDALTSREGPFDADLLRRFLTTGAME